MLSEINHKASVGFTACAQFQQQLWVKSVEVIKVKTRMNSAQLAFGEVQFLFFLSFFGFLYGKKNPLMSTRLLFCSSSIWVLQQPEDERFWAEDVSAKGKNEAGDFRIQN